MNQILNYDIHNILKVRLNRDRKIDLINGFDLELSAFRTQHVDAPDITINIGKFNPSNKDCFIVDNKYFVKENYLYLKDSIKGIKWEAEVNNFENGNTVINYNCFDLGITSLISRFSYEIMLLRPLIYYKLCEKGFLMLHAAGVSKNNHAYVLAGRGSSFKTSIVMNLIRKHGFHYLGDDWIILNNDNVLSFPAHFTLFRYLCMRKDNEDIKLSDKIDFIRSIWKDNYVCNEVPTIDSSNLKCLFFLNRTTSKDLYITPLDTQDAVNKLVNNNLIEASSASNTLAGYSLGPYYTYMLAYSYIFPESKIASFWDDFKKHLIKILGNTEIYNIYTPNYYDNSLPDTLCRFIKGLC